MQKTRSTVNSNMSYQRFELLTSRNQGFARRRSDFKLMKPTSTHSLSGKFSMAKVRSTISQYSSNMRYWQRERELSRLQHSQINASSLLQLQVDMDRLPRSSPNDSFDFSTHPSYNIMQFRYDLNCYNRYKEASELYEKTFQREIKQLIDYKPSILEQYFAKIPMQYTTLWPPLHSKREIELFKRKFFQLSPKQKRRLDYLMNTNIV